MTMKRDATRLCNFIRSLPSFEIRLREGACYAHMGATICDAILQAGLNYRTVVAPRVQRVLTRWPTAITTSRFSAMVARHGLNEILLWRNAEKPSRIGQLADFLRLHGIETESDARTWLAIDGNAQTLQTVRGVGPKTVDYFSSLVGMSAVAVDRHVRTFVGWAGIRVTNYDDVREVVNKAAASLQLDPRTLDHTIWTFVSTRQQRAA